jgi:ADP-ribosylglycohydrolase
MVAQALIASGGDPDAFTRKLAQKMRWWLVGLPAGVGRATLVAIVKLWLGVSPARSGVFSAGNGPAMRSAVLGASVRDVNQLASLVQASTRITHTDPKAEYGALAVAYAARCAASGSVSVGSEFFAGLADFLPQAAKTEFLPLVERAVQSAAAGDSTPVFAESLGLGRGVTGYVYHTVPVALHSWLRNQRDFRSGVMEVIRCGGDCDTTAAIVGGIIGSGVGKNGIPAAWISRMCEWPRTAAWMEALGETLEQAAATGKPAPPPRLPAAGIACRNAVFLVVVLTHALLRCFPPY